MAFLLRAVLVAVLLVGLTGCVYLRLLDVQHQFRDFARYIEVPPGPELELRFRQPPLLADDIETLTGGTPTATAAFPGGEVRTYAFARLPPEEAIPDPPGASTTLVLTTTLEGGRLRSVTFPPEIFRAVPRDLALAALQAMGHARVDTATRSAVTQVETRIDLPPLPTDAELIGVFGVPQRLQRLPGGGHRWVWRYRLIGKAQPPVIAAMAFVFAEGQERPRQFQVNVHGLWLYLDLGR